MQKDNNSSSSQSSLDYKDIASQVSADDFREENQIQNTSTQSKHTIHLEINKDKDLFFITSI